MIDPNGIGVFKADMSVDEANSWLLGDTSDLSIEANGAIDEAASWASAYGRSVVIIEINQTTR